MTEVVAALIWEGETFLICQRPAHKARGLLWEFVGGKVEPGRPGRRPGPGVPGGAGHRWRWGSPSWRSSTPIPDLTVHLTLFHASIAEGTPRKLEHQDIRWIRAAEIPQYRFCPADEAILERLREVAGCGGPTQVGR